MELDAFPPELRKQAYEIGQVLRMEMYESDGIRPKPGKNSKLKRFVILGQSKDSIIAALLINSRINDNLKAKIGPYQHKIFSSDYDFLDHDSYIDGYSLRQFDLNRVTSNAEYLGRINDSDLQSGIDKVFESPDTKPYLLKKFSLFHSK